MENKNIKDIENTLVLIKNQIGIDLDLCDHFNGIRVFNDKPYFNALLKDRISESLEYEKLKRWSDKYKKIQLHNNGLKRIAIFI